MKCEDYLAEHVINSESKLKFGLVDKVNELGIPVKDKDGKLLGYKYRNLNFNKDDPNSNKFRFDLGLKVSLFNVSSLTPGVKEVVYCEGEIDCIRLNQEGITAVSGTGGRNFQV